MAANEIVKFNTTTDFNESNIGKYTLGGLKVCVPIYRETKFTTIGDKYLREGNAYANTIGSIGEYLKIKHGIYLSRGDQPLYDVRGEIVMNGGARYPVRFLVFERGGSGHGSKQLLFLAVVCFEGVNHVVYEGYIKIPFSTDLIDLSMLEGGADLISFNSESQSKGYLDEYKGSIGNSQGGFAMTFQTHEEKEGERGDPQDKIRLVYDWALDWDYVQIHRENSGCLAYTWLLNEVTKNDSQISLSQYSIINIKDNDDIYPLDYSY